jgi:hypothetical protein
MESRAKVELALMAPVALVLIMVRVQFATIGCGSGLGPSQANQR